MARTQSKTSHLWSWLLFELTSAQRIKQQVHDLIYDLSAGVKLTNIRRISSRSTKRVSIIIKAYSLPKHQKLICETENSHD